MFAITETALAIGNVIRYLFSKDKKNVLFKGYEIYSVNNLQSLLMRLNIKAVDNWYPRGAREYIERIRDGQKR